MSNFSFFTPESTVLLEESNAKASIENFAERHKKQTYVVCRPLSKDDSVYDYDHAAVLFISGMKPCFINFGTDSDAFDDYKTDFIDDISFLSEKFKYREKIGRKKHWESLFVATDIKDLNFDHLHIDNAVDRRSIDLIISLVVGSINDISKINLEPQNLLDIVKSKITLFDTDQTEFVFKDRPGKKYVIQGLAGSGKTELLLHKLKEIYSNDLEARIAFTCYNKILASSMRSRIPGFFDFMRVERQIDWEGKLFCFHAWGSSNSPHSGMYRYICHAYEIPFGTLMAGTFDSLCSRAIQDIQALEKPFNHLFDYVFIDESQDFGPKFIELCELVTSRKVFIAGDVFQNIFRPIGADVNEATTVLKKCYRTDPKNLMFSHALAMGLFEPAPVLRWLTPQEWNDCGYSYLENDGRAKLSRDPLRRFEDIPTKYPSTVLHTLDNWTIVQSIIDIINDLKNRHTSLLPGDIAIIFLDREDYIYDEIATLKLKIGESFEWDSNVSFETKNQDSSKVFISNINNAKGLEFPFVICFSKNIRREAPFRNALYTMLARSFLESHLILGPKADRDTINLINAGLQELTQNNYLNVRIPSQEEIIGQEALFTVGTQLSIEEHVNKFLEDKNPTPRLVAKLVNRLTTILEDAEYDAEYVNNVLTLEYERHRRL